MLYTYLQFALVCPIIISSSYLHQSTIPIKPLQRLHITPVLKSLHWVRIAERIHFKVLSITYNSLQSSQPTYLHKLFTIQPTCSTRSSSCLTLSRPPVTFHLMFSKGAISITAPGLWNDLPP